MNGSPPRSAYVHVPFCRHRCGYCNFTVVAGRDDLISDYLRALEIELSWLGDPQPVDTLFFGGGTPTHLAPNQLRQLFDLVAHWFPTAENAEVSVEANPEDIQSDVVDVLGAAGVGRVSLGVQSFRDEKLRVLERSHTRDTVASSVILLSPVVTSLSIDLIFGAPNESLDQWQADLRAGIELPVDHVSTYGLTYEQGTAFHSRLRKDELVAAPEETERAMYEMAIEELRAGGFEQYEVSNFARPGHRCQHNENYWHCGEFFGVGPGASMYVDGERKSNHRSTSTYLKRVLQNESPIDEVERLTAEDAAHERLVFGLRRLEGIHLSEFHQQTGRSVHDVVGEPLTWLLEEELLEMTDDTLRLTRKGLFVSDSIWPHLL